MTDKGALELLRIAICPNKGCQGGVIPHQVGDYEWEPEQCQWCYERDVLLRAEEAKKAEGQDATQHAGIPTGGSLVDHAPAPSAPVSSEKVQPLSLGDVLHYELEGVIHDIDDEVCKDTLRRVQAALNEHFAVSAIPAMPDGQAIYYELSERERGYVSPEAIGAVVNAILRLRRVASTTKREGE